VTSTRLLAFEAETFCLEFPVEDLSTIAEQLEVSVEPMEAGFLLSGEASQCALRFVVDQQCARLSDLVLRDDERGRFFQQVLGALLVQYEGQLSGWAVWSNHGEPARVTVRNGISRDPLLAALASARDGALEMLPEPCDSPQAWERALRWQAASQEAFREYQEMKRQRAEACVSESETAYPLAPSGLRPPGASRPR
jgi:hypothetical protein